MIRVQIRSDRSIWSDTGGGFIRQDYYETDPDLVPVGPDWRERLVYCAYGEVFALEDELVTLAPEIP